MNMGTKSDLELTEFLKNIEPIIKTKARQYGRYIKMFDAEDLMQEGRIVALKAFHDCQICEDHKANLISWTWIRIHARFAELAKAGYTDEESLDEMDKDISSADIDSFVGQYFESSEEQNEFLDLMEKMVVDAAPGKLERFLSNCVENGHVATSAAETMTVTPQRISQLKKLAQDCFKF